MAVIKLKDGRTEIFTDKRIFDDLIELYMGIDALTYYHDVLTEYEQKLREMDFAKDDIADYVETYLIPELPSEDQGYWMDDFKEKMERVYGL